MTTQRRTRRGSWVIVLTFAAGVVAQNVALGARPKLTPEATQAIKARFPKAFIAGVEREREDEVDVFIVELENQGDEMGAQVSPSGVLVSIEKEISRKEIPRPVIDAIAEAAKGARVRAAARSEILAVHALGRFLKLKRPEVMYDAELVRGDMAAEIQVTADGRVLEAPTWRPRRAYGQRTTLPEKAAAAVKAAFPKARINRIELGDDDEGQTYEVELKQGQEEIEVRVTPDGVIVATETEVPLRKAPAAVAAAIKKVTQGGRLRELEKVEIRAVYEFGRYLELDQPFVTYEADFMRGRTNMEVTVAADGAVLQEPRRSEDDDEDEDD